MEFPGEKLVIKMWETVAEKGIGSLFKPWQMRREGRASIELKREELLVIAQAEREADLLRTGQTLTLSAIPRIAQDSPASPEADQAFVISLEQRAKDELISETIRREANVTRALLHAEDVLSDEPQQPPEEKVDDDWLFRWRDSAAQVSGEELQNLWGRVLAGEVKAPGSYSLRTLEFLKNLSQQEAEAIAKLSQFVISGVVYRGKDKALEKYDISFSFLLSMQQLGVISGVEAIGMNTTWRSLDPSRFVHSFISNSLVLIATADDQKKEISMPSYMLTAIGTQVSSLGTFETNVEYLEEIGEHFKSQGVTVKLAKYVRDTPTSIRYFDAREL
jgi:hypothetical protein